MLTLVYLALALLGCGYIILASFLGHLTDSGDSGVHHTEGGAQGSYGVDGSGHSSLSADRSAAVAFSFPFFSPLALAEKARGLAEAQIREAQGLAEALAMEKKAEAWRQYNEAAVLQILAPLLPEIARAIAEPLARIDRITMVNTGGNGDVGISKMTGEVAKVMAQVPAVVESLTGLKLEQLMQRLQPTGSSASPALATPSDSAADGAQAPAASPPPDSGNPKSSRAKNS